jgi:hypothetical protein
METSSLLPDKESVNLGVFGSDVDLLSCRPVMTMTGRGNTLMNLPQSDSETSVVVDSLYYYVWFGKQSERIGLCPLFTALLVLFFFNFFC